MVVLELGPLREAQTLVTESPGVRVYSVVEGDGAELGSEGFRHLGQRLRGSVDRVAGLGCGFVGAGEEVVLAVWSSGWGLAEEIFRTGDDRIRGLLSVDAYFVGLRGGVLPGHAWFLERAAAKEGWALVSTSARAGFGVRGGRRVEFLSSDASFREVAIATMLQPSGMVETKGPLMGVDVFGRGCACWYRCGKRWTHSQHAEVVAPWLWSEVNYWRGRDVQRRVTAAARRHDRVKGRLRVGAVSLEFDLAGKRR